MMEGSMRMMQDGERQRAVANRLTPAVHSATKAAKTQRTTKDPATVIESMSASALHGPKRVLMQIRKRKETEAALMELRKMHTNTNNLEQRDGGTSGQRVSYNPPQTKQTKQRKRGIFMFAKSKEHRYSREKRSPSKPIVGLARHGRLSNKPSLSLASSLTPSLLSRTGSLIRSPSVVSHHATAVKLTKLAPTKIAVEPRTKAVAKAERFGTTTVQDTDFRLLRPVTTLPTVPPRSASKNFVSLLQNQLKPQLLALPKDIRERILAYVVVADHEIMVCKCG